MLRHMLSAMLGIAVSLTTGWITAFAGPVPSTLEDWRGWALDGQEYRRCPLVTGNDASGVSSFRCVWPERLSLSLDARGGTFAQGWQVYAESWVRLPGNAEHWPQGVRVNGAPGAVVARDGVPMLLLAAGHYEARGVFTWSARPEALEVDSRTALIDLRIDGRSVAQPERPSGAVWLGKRRSAEQPERMEVQVYRLLKDQVPAQLTTLIRLQVGGEAREEMLARALPSDFTPVALESALPARVESDGTVRVQVRPGSWEITLNARASGVAHQLQRPAASGAWAREEIWSFEGDDRLRIAAVEGAEGVDPAQVNVPPQWRAFPAFRMAANSKLTVVERSRGLENVDDNRLVLERQVWLDFDHGGMTAVDHIYGRMLRDWRIETLAPFAVQSATSNHESLLITRNPEGQGVGLEVRNPNIDLQATTRSAQGSGSLPATGWRTRFDSARGQLNLPPGHLLIAVAGADNAPTAWLERWGLWGVFGVLVVAVFAGWLAGVPVGVVAFVGLILTYQESPAYIWLWSSLLAAMALARAAPEGRLRKFARAYRVASFVLLGVALLPMMWGQVRLALYPQLEDEPLVEVKAVTNDSLMRAPTVRTDLAPPRAASVEEAADAATDAAGAATSPAIEEEVITTASRRESDAPNPYEPASVAPTYSSVSSGLNYEQSVQRYAPGTLLQTGPGIPRWGYQTHPYSWSGPVEPTQTARFIYIGPIALGVWRIAGVVLLAVLFAALLRISDVGNLRWSSGWGERFLRIPSAAAILAMLALSLAAPSARAEVAVVDGEMLEELKTRLTRPPRCLPSCADISSARAMAKGSSLEVTMDVSVLTNSAVPMPSAADRWQLESITVDGRAALAMAREGDDSLWIPLSPGAHTVRLAGRLADAESIQVAFPSPPRHVTVSNEGWDVAGLNEGRLLAGSLELTRRSGAVERTGPLDSGSEYPAFVRVVRNIDLSLDWTVTTVVERISPQRAAMSLEVPLLDSESVLTEGIEVRGPAQGPRVALVGLERGQLRTQWSSGLPRSEKLELQWPTGSSRSEVWRFSVSPQWNVDFAGMPAVLPANENSSTWTFEFYPRPGETLQLRVRRPERAEGPTLAIDSVRQQLSVGKRSTTATTQISYRSTQGGRHSIAVPKEARVTGVQIDGQSVQVRPIGEELAIELRPGSHEITLEWLTPDGAGWRSRPDAVDLHSPASNLDTSITLPRDRWPLLAFGSGVGPVILYWGELVVALATAWLLGRWRRSPLRTHEWLLLALGLSTRSWIVLVIVALWLFALRWREGWDGTVARWRFNFVQVALALLTLIAVGSLVFSGIRGSLLASPDMGIAGPSSSWNTFSWFDDRTGALLPRPSVLSAPMWLYRTLMFAWAMWLVFALLRWLRWAWAAWKANGIWRGAEDQEIQETPAEA